VARERRQLSVRDGFAVGDGAKSGDDGALKRARAVQIELDVAEVVPLAAKVGDEPVAERRRIARPAGSAGRRQLVSDEDVAVEPELADAITRTFIECPR
jgi:hypothetical protein